MPIAMSGPRILAVVLVALGALLAPRAARADAVPPQDLTCTFKHKVHEFESLARMPARLRAALPSPMADKGEDFNLSDVVMQGPHGELPFQRFIRAGYAGNIVFVWYEQGGRGYSRDLRLLASVPEVAPIQPLGMPRTGNLCERTDAVIDTVSATRDYRTCQFSPAVTEAESLIDLPGAIRAHLPFRIADKGEAFNTSDVIISEPGKPPPPNMGVVRLGHLGPRWFLWIFQGGIAALLRTEIYDESGKHLTTQMGWDNVCARTEALLTAP